MFDVIEKKQDIFLVIFTKERKRFVFALCKVCVMFEYTLKSPIYNL